MATSEDVNLAIDTCWKQSYFALRTPLPRWSTHVVSNKESLWVAPFTSR
jgi:hypothetical protein